MIIENRVKQLVHFSAIILLIISCSYNKKHHQRKQLDDKNVNQHDSVEIAGYKFLNGYPLKNIPIQDTTNFNNFKFNDSLSMDQISLLKLGKICHGEGTKYWIDYRLRLIPNYNSITVTYMPNDNELYTVLINYTSNFKIIDYDTISYDEIAEGCLRIWSRIDKNIIKRTKLDYCSDENEKQVQVLTVDTNGLISTSR